MRIHGAFLAVLGLAVSCTAPASEPTEVLVRATDYAFDAPDLHLGMMRLVTTY